MRKWIHWVSLVLAAAGVLWAAALTAGAQEETPEGITIDKRLSDSTVGFVEDNNGKIQVTVTSSSIKPEEQYLVVMVKGLEENPVITEGNILYIDQKAAGNADGNGTLSFELYPSSIENSVILISGVVEGKPGPVVLAVLNVEFILGDVNGNGVVDVDDALMVLQYSVNLRNDVDERAADVNHSKSITSADASLILQYCIGRTTSLG